MNSLRSDQLAPHSVDAEEAVLGAVLITPYALADVDFLAPEDFFIVRHAWIYEAMKRLEKRREPVDVLTVEAELETAGQLAEIGGGGYLLSLFNKTPSALNVDGYGHVVQRMAIRRRLLEAASRIARAAHSDNTEIEDILTTSEQAIHEVTRQHAPRRISTLSELASEDWDEMSALMRGGLAPGYGSGLELLDRIVRFRAGDFITIAARPGMGKTALLQTIIANNSTTPIGLLSMEMSERQVYRRWVSALTKIPFTRLEGGQLTSEEWNRYREAMSTLHTWPVVIDDNPRLTPETMRNTVARMVHDHDIKILVLDYLQLMTNGTNERNRAQELSLITRECKVIAREFSLPLISAAQLNRGVEERNDKHPLLSDLRESGSIEQDSDVVMFIYRDAYYNPETSDGNRAEIHVAKHRNGPTGHVDVIWQPEQMRFVNAYRTHIELNPESAGTHANASMVGK